MWVETRIHLTLTAMQARDFAIPLCSTWHLHTASDSGVEGKKKFWGMKKKQQKIELIQREGCGEFNKWEQKKCQWVVKLNSLHGYFSNLVIFLGEPSKIGDWNTGQKSILKKWALQSEFISEKIVEKKTVSWDKLKA